MNKTEGRMENKKELTRLLIYLGFAFVLTWLVFFVFILTGHTWDYSGQDLQQLSGSDATNQNLQQLVGLGMLAPVIAHVLTRKITKEGFAMTGRDSMMLGISFRDRKWIYFVIAVLLPWIYTELGNGITLLLCPDLFDSGYYKTLGVEKGMTFIQPASAMVSGVFVSFAAFGEEGGWRGYMMPKLMKFMSPVKAMIVGGIIWGLWHAPLTCIGHNFGTDYPGFPYVGIFLMCIYCILVGIILTYVTEKSGSIWPAAILHAVNNAGPSILSMYMNFGKASGVWGETMAPWTSRMLSAAIFAVICFVAYAAPRRVSRCSA